MKFPKSLRARLFAAGSLSAVVVALVLIPFNMGGGCASGGIAIPGTGFIPGHGGGGVDAGAVLEGGRKMYESQTIDDKTEKAIGQSVALEATNNPKMPLYRDQELTRYVTLVARTVGSVSSLRGLKWYVGILDTDEVNAFSGPYGYIFITRGALKRMKDESELAGVLGHEIGHVCKHHGRDAVKNANFWGGLTTAVAGADQRAKAFQGATDVAVKAVIINGFSKAQEEEADAEGVKYVIAAGYDPHGFLHFLKRIEEEKGKGGNPFGTHPGIGERVTLVEKQIAKAAPKDPGMTLSDRFALNMKLH